MKKRLLTLVLSLALVFAFMPAGVFSAYAADAKAYVGKTVILHSNDVHGALDGYQYMAGVKAYYEEQGADVIVADAGDYSQGSPYVSTSKGASAVEMMNLVGYDVATLGNHEFDYGWAQLKNNLEAADFEVLCADILENDEPIYKGHTIIEREDGIKVGFFGMDTPEAQTKVNPALIQGLEFLTEDSTMTIKECAAKEVSALKDEGADVVIALSHLGVDAESEPYTSYDVFDGLYDEGLDFVIDGHSHTVMTCGDNGEPIQSTGTAFANIGVIVIDNATKEIEWNGFYGQSSKYTKSKTTVTPHDAAVDKAAARIMLAVDEEYSEVFATSDVTLNGEKAPNGNRDSETNNGDLITDAMVWSVLSANGIDKVDENHVVAVTNGGGIRAAINPGPVTKFDVNAVLPFGNTVAVVYVKGKELLEALEASTFCTPTAVGGFPQISGMHITLDTTAAYNPQGTVYPGSTYYGPNSINRVSIVDVNGEEFDPDATYAVVTNNFCAAGGDTYYAFAAASSQFDTGIPLDEALMSYVKEMLGGVIGEQYAAPQGRILQATLEANGHKLAYVPKLNPTYLQAGHKEYYYAIDSNQYFTDADATNEVTLKSLTLAKKKAVSQKITVKKAVPTYKAASLKNNAKKFSLGAKAKGKLTYKVVKGSKKNIVVDKNGKVTLKKGCKKGTYKVKISAAQTRDGHYKKATRTIKIVVK